MYFEIESYAFFPWKKYSTTEWNAQHRLFRYYNMLDMKIYKGSCSEGMVLSCEATEKLLGLMSFI